MAYEIRGHGMLFCSRCTVLLLQLINTTLTAKSLNG
jgi:uncharacterized membrane protein